MADAYREVADADPFLPFPDSVLPALVALRTTNATITESRRFLAAQKASLQDAQDCLEAERAALADQQALTQALEKRTKTLRAGIESRSAMTPDQVAREKIAGLKNQIKETDTDRTRLREALERFIDERLAPLLAAEQIGGPVAGDMMDVDDEVLEAGFSATGKRRKPNTGGASPDKRQRRIDDMFGGGQGQGRAGGAGAGSDEAPDRQTAAGDEMQQLVVDLMNKLIAAQGSSSDAYVSIPEESAAVRYLTRVKVAEFHPRDSRRLRLVDFGREIAD